MRIGKQDAPFTAISTADAASITVRGRDLCKELIGRIDFADYFFLLLMGEMPSDNQRFFVNALLVAIAEHGLVPSVQAARMTLAAAPEALQGAVAAGILGCGSVILGSSEAAGKIEFRCYDPNICEAPITLIFDRDRRRFIFPRTHYFQGGLVNAYEIYRGWCL